MAAERRSRKSAQHACTNRRMLVHLGTCAECRWNGAEPEMLVGEDEEEEEEEVGESEGGRQKPRCGGYRNRWGNSRC